MERQLIQQFLDALLAGNRAQCHWMVSLLLDQGLDVQSLYLDLFQPVMYEVGRLWETDRISVATEHLATDVTESLMTLTYPRLFAVAPLGKTALVACPAGERHQLGGKMVADLMHLSGWDACFLGADTPLAGLLAALEQRQPDLLGLSLCMGDRVGGLAESVARVRGQFPGLAIVLGGQAFVRGGSEEVRGLEGVTVLEDARLLPPYLAGLAPRPR